MGTHQGASGRYLVVPPGCTEAISDDGFVSVLRPRTYGLRLIVRAFLDPNGDTGPTVATMKQVRIYRDSDREKPPPMRYLDATDASDGTIHPIDIATPNTSPR